MADGEGMRCRRVIRTPDLFKEEVHHGCNACITPTTPAGRVDAGTDQQRRSTETKHSSKTGELYAMIAVILGILIAPAAIKGGDSGGTDEFIARQAWLYVAIVAAAYMISRGWPRAAAATRTPPTRMTATTTSS